MNEAPVLSTNLAPAAATESALNPIEFPKEQADQKETPHHKTANLPRKLRDLINTMLDDNRSARDILEALRQSDDPPLPYDLSEMCISRWRHSGYRRYLANQE